MTDGEDVSILARLGIARAAPTPAGQAVHLE
jgi:hypothetical protein